MAAIKGGRDDDAAHFGFFDFAMQSYSFYYDYPIPLPAHSLHSLPSSPPSPESNASPISIFVIIFVVFPLRRRLFFALLAAPPTPRPPIDLRLRKLEEIAHQGRTSPPHATHQKMKTLL